MTVLHPERAFVAFDAINGEDPNLVSGQPASLLYGRRMSERLAAFTPDASEVVQLAVRAQHIGRWKIARSEYPDGRAGYLKWRTDLGKFHADLAGGVLAGLGASADTIERVQTLLRKRGLKTDPEVQLLEDVACLVFLEHYLPDFKKKHPREKLIAIIQKTWKKMSDTAHEAAFALPYEAEDLVLVREALSAAESSR